MIPTVIKVCGIPHTVMLCEDNFSANSHFGEIDYTKAEIRINKNMPNEMQNVTLIHEWLHAALVMLGFNEATSNEQFVNALSTAISQTFVLKDGEI